MEDPNGGGIDPVTIRRGLVAQGFERSPNAEDVVAVAALAYHLSIRPVLSPSMEPTYGPWWAFDRRVPHWERFAEHQWYQPQPRRHPSNRRG